MAYNSYFPTNYQPVQFPQQSQYYQQNQTLNNGSVIWVQGEAGAKSYLVAPNSTVQLWDSESQTIYLKSADSSGMPSMRVLDYKIRENNPIQEPKTDYVTKTELDELKEQVEDLKAKLKKKEKEKE